MLSREWRCSWSSADRRCSNYIWVIKSFIAYEGAPCIRGLMVMCLLDEWCDLKDMWMLMGSINDTSNSGGQCLKYVWKKLAAQWFELSAQSLKYVTSAGKVTGHLLSDLGWRSDTISNTTCGSWPYSAMHLCYHQATNQCVTVIHCGWRILYSIIELDLLQYQAIASDWLNVKIRYDRLSGKYCDGLSESCRAGWSGWDCDGLSE